MKHSRIILFYILAAAVAVYARTAQILYLTEEKTGFFIKDSAFVAYLLCAVLLGAIIAAAVISVFSKRMPDNPPKGSPLLSCASAVMALSLMYDAIFAHYVTTAAFLVIITRILAVLSAVAFGLYALAPYFSEKIKLNKIVLAIIPLYFVLKLISVFTVYTTVSVIADNVFPVLFLCSSLVFFTLVAKIENSVSLHRNAFHLFPAAVVCSISAICCFLPQLIAFAFGRGGFVHSDIRLFPIMIASAFFAVSYIFSLYKKDNLKRYRRQTHSLKGVGSYDELDSQFFTDNQK